MSAEQILDAALALTALPSRIVLLDDYAHDLLALQHAAAHVGGYAEV